MDVALNLDEGDFEAKYGFAKPAKDAKLVTHCMKGGRAGKGAKALTDAGWTNVVVYVGSFNDWKANDGPTEKNN